MTVFTEGPRAGFYIADEVSVNLSRKEIVVSSGSGVVLAGTVLMASSDEFVPLTGGSTAAVGILFDTVDATDADQRAVMTADLTAVNGSELIWPAGYSPENKATATAALEALGITVLAADPIPSGS